MPGEKRDRVVNEIVCGASRERLRRGALQSKRLSDAR